MAAEPIDDENEEFNAPHLPERYHQTVKAKKQRRLKKQLLTGGVAIIVIIALYFLLSWAAGGLFSSMLVASPAQQPATPSPGQPENTATNTTPSFTQGAGLTSPLPQGVIALDTAIVALRGDYPASGYTLVNADLVERTGRRFYEFGIQPRNAQDSAVSTVFVDAASGSLWSPGEETAQVTRDEAKKRALAAFSAVHPDRCVLIFSQDTTRGATWDFVLYRGSNQIVTGRMDAGTGKVSSFKKIIAGDGRPSTPVIDSIRAQAVADRYLIEQNGGQLPLNLSVARYDTIDSTSGPVAGHYTFIYERTFQDFLADVDGFTVIIDGVTGEVIGYTQQWTTPEHAFSASAQPDIIKREATFAVMQKAKEQYPAAVGGLRIISADIRWKNQVPYGTVPRPGSIPLAWKVVFDDDIIRANTTAHPAVAWVDAQSGDFIEFDYRH